MTLSSKKFSINVYALIFVLLIFNSSNLQGQCTVNFDLSTNQCSNQQSLVFSNYDSSAAVNYWAANKIPIDSLNTRVNLGDFGTSIGFNTGIELVNESGNWYGYYHKDNANNFYRLDFGNSLSNTPSSTQISVNGIGTTSLVDGSLDFHYYNGEWHAFTCTRSPVSVVRYDFGSSRLSDTITATLITNLSGQVTLPLDVDIQKQGTDYYMSIVGLSNKLVIYNLGQNLLNTTPLSYLTINTSTLSPAILDPRSFVSETICDTTVLFLSGLNSSKINRLIFPDLSTAPSSVSGVSTSTSWVSPYQMKFESDHTGNKIYVQQYASNSNGKLIKIDCSDNLTSSNSESWPSSVVYQPSTLNTNNLSIGYESGNTFVFHTSYSSPKIYRASCSSASVQNQLLWHGQASFPLNQLSDGVNYITSENIDTLGQLNIVQDTINLLNPPDDHITFLDSCFNSTNYIIVYDSNQVVQSRNWDFGNGVLSTSLNDTLAINYLNPGTYQVSLSSYNESCSFSDTFSYTIYPAPSSLFTADTTCSGEVIPLTI